MEVLVALVILSIAFTALFRSMSSNANSLIYLQNKTAATWVGLNIIAEAQLGLTNIKGTQSSSHQVMMFNKNFYWEAVTQATPNPSIIRIIVSVKPSEYSRPIIHLTGYLRNDSA